MGRLLLWGNGSPKGLSTCAGMTPIGAADQTEGRASLQRVAGAMGSSATGRMCGAKSQGAWNTVHSPLKG